MPLFVLRIFKVAIVTFVTNFSVLVWGMNQRRLRAIRTYFGGQLALGSKKGGVTDPAVFQETAGFIKKSLLKALRKYGRAVRYAPR